MPHISNFIYTRLGVPAQSSGAIFDPDRKYVSSPVMPPLALAAVRLLVGGYTFVTLVVKLALEVQADGNADR